MNETEVVRDYRILTRWIGVPSEEEATVVREFFFCWVERWTTDLIGFEWFAINAFDKGFPSFRHRTWSNYVLWHPLSAVAMFYCVFNTRAVKKNKLHPSNSMTFRFFLPLFRLFSIHFFAFYFDQGRVFFLVLVLSALFLVFKSFPLDEWKNSSILVFNRLFL